MKAVIFLIFIGIISGCANAPSVNEGPEKADEFMIARTGGNFTDQGAIAVFDDDYRFTIILVKDLEWALHSIMIADYGLPHISQFRRGEKVTPYLTFGTFGKENVDLNYSVKLQRPDGQFAPGEYHDMVIARRAVVASNTYQAQEFATVGFNETDALGVYQFHIIMKDSGDIVNSCIMQFELIE